MGQVAPGKSHVDGIKYSSSVHTGHASFVLFANQKNIEATSASEWSGRCLAKVGRNQTYVGRLNVSGGTKVGRGGRKIADIVRLTPASLPRR